MASKKVIYICVQKDVLHPISWTLKEFDKYVSARVFDKIYALQKSDILEVASVLIIDSIVANESSRDLIQELKQKRPGLRILLLASVGTTKEELIEIIKMKIVNGVLVRPFTAEQLSDYIYKLCDIPKPSSVPWYMQNTTK